jgi:PAS domain-containing protein
MPSSTPWMKFSDLPQRGAVLLRTKLERLSRPQRLAVLLIVGAAALALAAAACSQLGLNFATAAFALLTVVVGVSLLDGFISSAVLSVIAVGCLSFFVVEPLHTFVVGDAQDLTALTAFLLTSLAVSGLVSRLGTLQREHARLLGAYEALERSAQRYRTIFEHMPIGLCQVDASAVAPLFRELREQGVTDLKAYIDEHPEFVRRTQDLMIVEEANEELARIHGAKSAAELVGPATRFWEPDLFDGARRLLESRYRGEMFFRPEVKLRALNGRVIDAIHAVARAGPMLDRSLRYGQGPRAGGVEPPAGRFRPRGARLDAGRADRLHRARGQPAAGGHCDQRRGRLRITCRVSRSNSCTPSRSSSRRTCWLMAPAVTCNSCAACLKLRWRAAASKARRALSGGSR